MRVVLAFVLNVVEVILVVVVVVVVDKVVILFVAVDLIVVLVESCVVGCSAKIFEKSNGSKRVEN